MEATASAAPPGGESEMTRCLENCVEGRGEEVTLQKLETGVRGEEEGGRPTLRAAVSSCVNDRRTRLRGRAGALFWIF